VKIMYIVEDFTRVFGIPSHDLLVQHALTRGKVNFQEAVWMVKCSHEWELVAAKHLQQCTSDVYALCTELQQLKSERATSSRSPPSSTSIF
ncbi:hypothetical protein KI387_014039, partial [Taxus chinensis]